MSPAEKKRRLGEARDLLGAIHSVAAAATRNHRGIFIADPLDKAEHWVRVSIEEIEGEDDRYFKPATREPG